VRTVSSLASAFFTGLHGHTPLCLHTNKNPNPSPKYLQNLDYENASLDIVEVIEMRGELQAPSASKHEVNDDYSVVEIVAVKVAVPSEAVRMLRVVSIGREKRKIPVLCYVPIEGI